MALVGRVPSGAVSLRALERFVTGLRESGWARGRPLTSGDTGGGAPDYRPGVTNPLSWGNATAGPRPRNPAPAGCADVGLRGARPGRDALTVVVGLLMIQRNRAEATV